MAGDYLFDGIKSIPLQGYPLDERIGMELDDTTHTLSPLNAYQLVPYLYRAIDIRAKTLATIPWRVDRMGKGDETTDVTYDPTYAGLVAGMRQRLFMTESALCLYGAAYWLREHNPVGLQERVRWVLPSSISPRYDGKMGLVGFERTSGSGTQRIALDRMVAFWQPNMAAELGPGVAPAQVALASAQVLHSLDRFAEGFFRRGAIKATLLSVEGNPPPGELERLETWWRRMLAGVRNAWQSIAIRSSVKPIVIGDGLADTQNRELTIQQREHICAALGVPHSLLSADAANYATAANDKLTFLHQTVIPSARLIEETLNDQLFQPLGLRLRFLPEQMEELQKDEMDKATSLVPLVQEGIITIDEARAFLGLGTYEHKQQHERKNGYAAIRSKTGRAQ